MLKTLTTFLDTNYKDTSLQCDLCILWPFLMHNMSSKSTNSIIQLNQLIYTKLHASLKNSDKSTLNMAVLEKESLLMSLSVWSLMMSNSSGKIYSADTNISLASLVNLLKEFETFRLEVIADKSIELVRIEKCFSHVLRAVYFCMLASLKTDKKSDEVLEPIGTMFDLLKNQLSSPYHEVIKAPIFGIKLVNN